MLKKINVVCVSICLLFCLSSHAQRSAGPIISPFGAVHKVENPDLEVDVSQTYKVVFDIAKSPDQPGQINPQLNAAYQERYGMNNPNLRLLEALKQAGAEIYICGQSIHSRKIDRTELAVPVQVALSAMTVLITKQNEGYQLIAF